MTRQEAAARWRDERAILSVVREAGIEYRYAGGLGSGYELSVRLSDLGRWHAVVEKLHAGRSLAFYAGWQAGPRGDGIFDLAGRR